MKKLILGAAIATALTGSAFAQSYTPSIGTGNVLPPQVWQSPQANETTGALAYAPRHARAEYNAGYAVDNPAEDADIALRERIDAQEDLR